MGLLERYLLTSYLKLFLLVSGVILSVAVVYGLADLILFFKEKSLKVAIFYLINMVPLGFFILSPAITGISLILFLRKFIPKKADLIFQSFGLTPLQFSKAIILFLVFISLSFLFLNESVFPNLLRNIWYTEKIFKKKQDVGRLIRDLWFVKEGLNTRTYVYVGVLDTFTGTFLDLILITLSEEGKVLQLVEGVKGRWQGSIIEVEEGYLYDFYKAKGDKILKNYFLETEVKLSELEAFSLNVAHIRTSHLLMLYSKGAKLGIETDVYLAEILYRLNFSFFPLIVAVLILRQGFQTRDLKKTTLFLPVYLVGGWLFVVSPKIAVDKVGISPFYLMPLYLGVAWMLLKGLDDLRKGVRI